MLKSSLAKMSCSGLFCWILIQTFIVYAVSNTVITGEAGQSVTLPCFYRVSRRRDISDMCWGKGTCPNSKCRDKILHTTGNRVTYRVSQRYNLHGYISYGDVSLTIKNVKEEDAGVYCCRIEIPGWFNDIKVNVNLRVVQGTTLPATTRFETKELTMTPSAPDLQATVTTETAVLLTTVGTSATTVTEVTVPPILTDPPATTESPAVTMLETFAPPTLTRTENDFFPENVETTSAPIGFSTDFQTSGMMTEDDYVLSSIGFVNVPEVTTEFLSKLSSEGTENADTSFITEDELTAVTVPAPLISPRYRSLNGLASAYNSLAEDPATDISGSSSSKVMKNDDYQFPNQVVLITCSAGAFIFLMLMLSVLLCKYSKRCITKRPGPKEELEKVFSGAEGENGLLAL